MNKMNILIVGLVAFAAVLQVARADEAENLVSELPDEDELDDELEGGGSGFMANWHSHQSKARFAVNHGSESEYGRDIQLRGQTKLVEDRTSDCNYSKNEKECKSCCQKQESGANGKYDGRFIKRLQNSLSSRDGRKETCTCFSPSTAY